MPRPDIFPTGHRQPGLFDRLKQKLACAQTKMLSEIRQDQPAFSTGRQVVRQPVQEAEQHAAVVVVDRVFDRRRWPRRHPGWVTDHERRAAFGEQIGLDNFDLLGIAEAREILARARRCRR